MESRDNTIRKHAPGFVISAGTQVVLQTTKSVLQNDVIYRKPGSVGIVAKCPERADGEYLIEFANGETVMATFAELALRRKEIDNELDETKIDFRPYIIYRCQVGSKAYGLDHEESDDDIRGFFLPPADQHWSLYKIPEQLELLDSGQDEVFWEIEKFIRLCLKANPNVLELLWTPIVLHSTELATELRSIRAAFLSKHVFKTYSGYVLSQFRRMRNRFDKSNAYKPKHAMHLIRLLLSGIHALQTGEIHVDVAEKRDLLLNIREGDWSFEDVQQHALHLDREFQAAFDTTKLPEQPDFQRVNAFLIDARRQAISLS